jgi:hypothetical protein
MQDPVLWAALKDHPLPLEGKPADLHSLVVRHGGLAGWHIKTALREYRRFLYLAAIAGRDVAAPPVIHKIWRGHARYHRAYTVDLVRGLIRRPMPEAFDLPPPLSHPAHARTRALYRQEFGRAAPRAMWPGPLAMAFRQATRWAMIGFGGGMALLFMSQEPAWAVVAGLAGMASAMAHYWMSPWAFERREGENDIDFDADKPKSGPFDPFYGD